MDYLLAIDQGTTNTKALLINGAGEIVARASASLSQRYPQPGWVEQDPRAIWASVSEAGGKCLDQAERPKIAAIAITNQRETVTAWERESGEPLGPAIGWQCHRTAPFCAELGEQGLEPLLRERTGLTIDPMFSGTKMRWLLDHILDGRARAANAEICLGTMDSWLLWNLTGGQTHACDLTNASRTQLLNLHTLDWDDELLDVFGIPRPALPKIKPSGAYQGLTAGTDALPTDVPVGSLIGDSHAALYGHGQFGQVIKATFGTGSSLMCPTPTVINSGRGVSSTIAWSREGQAQEPAVTYALEGNIYATGAAVQWLGNLLGLEDPGPEIQALASQVADANGVYLVPAFGGLGAPHWIDDIRGLISGLTLDSGPAQLARAAIEAIAYQIRDVFDAMAADVDFPLAVLLADGGASRNDLLMQFQADIIGRPVERSVSPELSALGAAYLAGLSVDIWASEEEIAEIAPDHDRFEPQMSDQDRALLYDGWQAALERASQ